MSSTEGRESGSASGDTKDNNTTNNNNDQEQQTATTANNTNDNNESPSSSTNQNNAETTTTANNNTDSSAPAPVTNNTGDTPQKQQEQTSEKTEVTAAAAAVAPETSETTTTTTAKTAFAETDQNTNKADSNNNNNKDQEQQKTDSSAAAASAGTTTTENSNTNNNDQQQQQESSAAASTTGATAGNSTTATSSTAAASSSSPTATTATRPGRVRPVVQLTQNLVQTYHDANEKVYWRKRQDIPGPKFNDGYDDSSGHYIVYPGEEIIGRYVTLETLGKGSFGTVVRCKDTKRNEIVAAKITRSGSGFRNQAKLEIDILMRILTQSPDAKIVRILKAFDWKGHLVIVFELLSFNLYQLMQCTNYHGVSLDLTSKFAFQLLMVLRDLERLNPPVIHCDLKPENVLLVNQNRSAIRVIDFGSACYQNRRMFRYIQSRYYRSPEVILGLEYSTAIDRWSLGCILMELHTGVALFDGRNEAQQLQRFEGLLGPLPDSMIAASSKKDQFYDTMTLDDGTVAYTLKLQPEPQHRRTIAGILERPQRRRSSRANASSENNTNTTTGTTAASGTIGEGTGGTSSASTAATAVSGGNNNSSSSGGVESQERYEQFVDIVKKLLEYDPAKRIGVLQAMEHPFLCEFMPYYQQRLANQQQQQGGSSSSGANNTTNNNNNNNNTAGSSTTTTSANTTAATSTTTTTTAPSTTAAASNNNNNNNSTSGNNNNNTNPHPSASASTAQLPPPPSM